MSGTCCVFQYRTVEKGNQHGGREYDDVQNSWLDIRGHMTALYTLAFITLCKGPKNLQILLFKCLYYYYLLMLYLHAAVNKIICTYCTK